MIERCSAVPRTSYGRAVVGAHKTHESPEIIVRAEKSPKSNTVPGFSTSASRVNA